MLFCMSFTSKFYFQVEFEYPSNCKSSSWGMRRMICVILAMRFRSCSWPGDYPDACLLVTLKWRWRRFSTEAASVCSERILSCQAKNLVSNYPRGFDVLDCNDAFKFQAEGRMAAHRSTCVFTPREGHRPRGPIHWLHKQGVTKCHFPGSSHSFGFCVYMGILLFRSVHYIHCKFVLFTAPPLLFLWMSHKCVLSLSF